MIHTVVEHSTRLTPLLSKGSERRAHGFWFGEVQSEVESFGCAVLGFEGASCEGDAVAFGLEDCGGAEADVLAGADDEGDWFGHG
jgi:hypothetical protein